LVGSTPAKEAFVATTDLSKSSNGSKHEREPVLARFTAAADVTMEQYDETIRRLKGAGDWPPDGMAYHVAFGTAGNLRVSEVWDSREQFDAGVKRLMPILNDVGIGFASEPEMLEIHNIIQR
jgi:hypothetical protein